MQGLKRIVASSAVFSSPDRNRPSTLSQSMDYIRASGGAKVGTLIDTDPAYSDGNSKNDV